MSSIYRILVCVTQQKTCERLIIKASDLVKEKKGELFVIHVAKNNWNFLNNEQEGEALEYLFSISKSVGANLTVLKSDDIVKAIVDFTKENKINCLILGQSPGGNEESGFLRELKELLIHVEIKIIPAS